MADFQKTDEDPKSKNAVRIVLISDTHGKHRQLEHKVPNGDILIHAGDFTERGRTEELEDFSDWLAELPHKHKIVIAGTHEITFDDLNRAEDTKKHLTNCVYLENEAVEVMGIRFYGSPQVVKYDKLTIKAFALPVDSEDLVDARKKIPDDVDFLITHAPPLGVLDECSHGDIAGCEKLLVEVMERVKPKFHVFGHIHEGYGVVENDATTFINAATCLTGAQGGHPRRPPIVIDYES